MTDTPTIDNLTTRIIPGLTSEYQIVSLPYWAWFWLEDFMQQNRISFQGIYETFGKRQNVSETLQHIAELHHEYAMREIYNLANDNEPSDDVLKARIEQNKIIGAEPTRYKLPKIYKLFGFMSCATTLEALWERRNYEENNKIN